MSSQNEDLSPLVVPLVVFFFILLALLIFVCNTWVKPIAAIEEGAFEYEDEVYLVEKAPPGTILKDGKIYRTEEFTQTQPAEEE